MTQITDKQGNTFDAPFTVQDVANASASARDSFEHGFTAIAATTGRCLRCTRPLHVLTVGGTCPTCAKQEQAEYDGGGSLICPSCGETAWDDADAECWACGAPMINPDPCKTHCDATAPGVQPCIGCPVNPCPSCI